MAHPFWVLICLQETEGLAREMGSRSFKELSVDHAAHLLILCLRMVVLEAADNYKNGKTLPRQLELQ